MVYVLLSLYSTNFIGSYVSFNAVFQLKWAFHLKQFMLTFSVNFYYVCYWNKIQLWWKSNILLLSKGICCYKESCNKWYNWNFDL